MKFFHVGDLHFGKMLHNISLVEQDQPFWVEEFLQAVDQYQPDAIVMAGDIYDRKIPSPEAMKLFEHFLLELAKRDKYVFIIPGNHDSSVRLSHVKELLETHKIYIAGEVNREMEHISVEKDGITTTFWMMPYIFPKAVSDPKVLDQSEISTYDEAVRALIGAQKIDEGVCNVLIAHQNVLANGVAPEHSESETIIGGLGEIEVSAFDAFDYVALGHIHNAQKIGRETVRYSGCPLYYDFSEIKRWKGLTLVTVEGQKAIKIEEIEIPLLHKMIQVTGTLAEVLEEGRNMEDKEAYYVQCVLQNKHIPEHALEQLRAVFGDCMLNVKRETAEAAMYAENGAGQGAEKSLSLEEQFGQFYQTQNNELLDGDQEEVVTKILEQQTNQGGDYYADANMIPEADSQELIDFLLQMMKEDEA